MARSKATFETVVEEHGNHVMVGLLIKDPKHPHDRLRLAGIARHKLSRDAVSAAFDRLTDNQTPVMPGEAREQAVEAAIGALKL